MSEFPQRKSPLGFVKAGEMQLNPAGEAMAYWWQQLPTKFDDID